MKKIKGRIISLLTVTALISTGTVPQAIAEELNEGIPVAESITDFVINEQKEDEEPAYITGEVEELRTKYSKTYEQSDGSMAAVVSAAPIHFYNEEKETWEEYDNRLIYNEETENYESNENGRICGCHCRKILMNKTILKLKLKDIKFQSLRWT